MGFDGNTIYASESPSVRLEEEFSYINFGNMSRALIAGIYYIHKSIKILKKKRRVIEL